MAKKGKKYELLAQERDDYSFEFTSGRHRLLMSKTMKSDEMPVTWFSPVDLLFAGLAGCLGMTIRATMEEKNLTYENLRIEIEGIVSDDPDRSGFGGIKTKVFMKTDVPLEQVKAIVEESEKDCTVRGTVEFTPEFETQVELG